MQAMNPCGSTSTPWMRQPCASRRISSNRPSPQPRSSTRLPTGMCFMISLSVSAAIGSGMQYGTAAIRGILMRRPGDKAVSAEGADRGGVGFSGIDCGPEESFMPTPRPESLPASVRETAAPGPRAARCRSERRRDPWSCATRCTRRACPSRRANARFLCSAAWDRASRCRTKRPGTAPSARAKASFSEP